MQIAYTPSTRPTNALANFERFHRHQSAVRHGERLLARVGWRCARVKRRELLAAAPGLLGSARYLASTSTDRATRRRAIAFAERLHTTVRSLR